MSAELQDQVSNQSHTSRQFTGRTVVGSIWRKLLSMMPAGAVAAGLGISCSEPARAELSQAAFSNPPIEARPSALWPWLNGNVDPQEITRELEEMKDKGMRGAIIWDVKALINPGDIVPTGPRFLGPESVSYIHHAMDEASRLGLELGLFASSSWNAGGTWIGPENASKALRWSAIAVEGPREFSEILPVPEKARGLFEDVAVLALPDESNKTVDGPGVPLRLDGQLAADGRLTWKVPAGKWRILRFVDANTGETLNCPSPNSVGLIIDHLSAKAVEKHLDYIVDTLLAGRKNLDPLKVLMFDSYEVHPADDWTPGFIAKFVERHQYDPVPWLPVLAGWTVGSEDQAHRFLHDYHKTVSDLIAEEHFARAREILNKRGLLLLAEGGHGGHARVDPLKALGAADIPMGEFWNHSKNWVTKEAASAAHIYGKRLVNAETFTGWQNWQDGPAGYKRLYRHRPLRRPQSIHLPYFRPQSAEAPANPASPTTPASISTSTRRGGIKPVR